MIEFMYLVSLALGIASGRLWERERNRRNITEEITRQLKDRFGGWPVKTNVPGGWPMRTWLQDGDKGTKETDQ